MMGNVKDIIGRYKKVNEQLEQFVLFASRLSYIEGSSQVVEGGAYAWAPLENPAQHEQSQIYQDYATVAYQARLIIENNLIGRLAEFDASVESVLSHISQGTIVFIADVDDAFSAIKVELDVQQALIHHAEAV